MSKTKNTSLKKAFTSFFQDKDGYFQHPGNIGSGRTVASVCRKVLQQQNPVLYDTLVEWEEGGLQRRDGQTMNILDITLVLRSLGQWEGAWAVAQLHYDQLLKNEAKTGTRHHKGHPACGLAILARELGSPFLSRHFALLSSAGDICWEHKKPELKDGGYGVTMLERHESTTRQQKWRQRIRDDMKNFAQSTPVYLEAFVAAAWFGSHSTYVYDFAEVNGKQRKPFTDVLLAEVEAAANPNTTATGTLFEATTGLLLASTPGFEIDSARKTTDEQIDLVVHYVPDQLSDIGLEAGFGLVECKSSKNRVGVTELRDFGSKCLFHRVKFGILVARGGVTKGLGLANFSNPKYAELVRRRFQVDGLTLLVLDISHLKNKSQELRGLQDDLRADHRRLVFGELP